MKNFKYLLRKKAIYLLGSIALIVVALAITYSCSKENVVKKNEPVPNAKSFEKHFIVFDKSGNNSVTLRVSTDDATLLTGHNAESYDLIINPEMPDETTYHGTTSTIEEAEFVDFNASIEMKRVSVQMDIINVNSLCD